MATFMEKEALIELLDGISGLVSRVSTLEEFKTNKDIIRANKIIDKLVDTDYWDIDFDKYMAIINEITAPYNTIEEAKIEIEKRNLKEIE